MKRVMILAEGQTEETFIGELLAPHLLGFDLSVEVTLITTGYRPDGAPSKGGHGHRYTTIRNSLRPLFGKGFALVTTLIDLYHLPKDFPGLDAPPPGPDPFALATHLEAALARDFGDRPEFMPYLQVHEFEALLFSAPACIAVESGHPEAEQELRAIAARFSSPEHINHDESPARRIAACIKGYRKVLHGSLAANAIGLGPMRAACKRFDGWVSRIEQRGIAAHA